MNTNTGAIYRLSEDAEPVLFNTDFMAVTQADFLGAKMDAEKRLGRELESDEQECLAAMLRGEKVVPVSEHVAQAQILGQRELRRRRSRRKAAKNARKRNR